MQRSRLAFFLLTAPLIFASTSCTAINYSFAPADTITLTTPITNNSAISYRFLYASDWPNNSIRVKYLDAIRKGLVSPSTFQAAHPENDIPETGLYVSVELAHHSETVPPMRSRGTFGRSLNLFLSMVTMYAIPYYGEPGGSTRGPWASTSSMVLTYTLYVDGARKEAYPYLVNVKVLRWILAPLVFPFLSTEWDTPFSDARRAQELLTSTARQFLRDAQRDGLL